VDGKIGFSRRRIGRGDGGGIHPREDLHELAIIKIILVIW
jgi:hypothetical protein